MALHWPMVFSGGASDALGWAHCISRCCCQWLHFSPLFFWEVLPMYLESVDVAVNGFGLAHYFSGRCS